MKQIIGRLRRGERIEGRVEEIQAHGELLVNFQGDLLRVSNESHLNLKPGEVVQLEVTATAPLRFQVIFHGRSKLGRLNQSI